MTLTNIKFDLNELVEIKISNTFSLHDFYIKINLEGHDIYYLTFIFYQYL